MLGLIILGIIVIGPIYSILKDERCHEGCFHNYESDDETWLEMHDNCRCGRTEVECHKQICKKCGVERKIIDSFLCSILEGDDGDFE